MAKTKAEKEAEKKAKAEAAEAEETSEEVTEEETEEVAEEVVEESKKKGKKEVVAVDVMAPNGQYVRTYSLEIHGKNFRDLAEEFVSGRSEFKIQDVA